MSTSKDEYKNSVSLNKKVLLKGPILTNSGYGVHTRQVFEALKNSVGVDLYVQPTQWGSTSWILSDKISDANVSHIVSYCQKYNSSKTFDVSYQVLLPNEWENLAGKNVGITAGFEADIVKEDWVSYCNDMDMVIVPSEFTKSAFIKTSETSKVKLRTEINVVNEWYYDDFDKISADKSFLSNLRQKNNILIVGQVTSNSSISDRKNILKTIKCAYDFALSNKDIGVVLKINKGKYTINDFKTIREDLRNHLGEIKKDKICLVYGSLNLEELKKLYESKNISCMLSGSRAEGWGLPFIEAAACGLPIIATNHSAYKEFLEDDFIKVNFDFVGFNQDINFVDKDKTAFWADFSKSDMTLKITDFFNNKEEYQKIAVMRQKIIKQSYNSIKIKEDYKKLFEKYIWLYCLLYY